MLSDNDIEYAPGWLEALEATALAEKADAVGPLIFIGPHNPTKVHHAGGNLVPTHGPNGLMMAEKHRLMNAAWPDVKDEIDTLVPIENEVCEFHCALLRREFIQRAGGLDERLVTREQMDFALQAKAHGGRVAFSSGAHVTYRAFDPITRLDDLHYFLFRWSDEKVVQSLDAFEENWAIHAERERVRYAWTRMHRMKAVTSYYRRTYRRTAKFLGRKRVGAILLAREERRTRARFAKALTEAPETPLAHAAPTAPAATFFFTEGAAK